MWCTGFLPLHCLCAALTFRCAAFPLHWLAFCCAGFALLCFCAAVASVRCADFCYFSAAVAGLSLHWLLIFSPPGFFTRLVVSFSLCGEKQNPAHPAQRQVIAAQSQHTKTQKPAQRAAASLCWLSLLRCTGSWLCPSAGQALRCTDWLFAVLAFHCGDFRFFAAMTLSCIAFPRRWLACRCAGSRVFAAMALRCIACRWLFLFRCAG